MRDPDEEIAREAADKIFLIGPSGDATAQCFEIILAAIKKAKEEMAGKFYIGNELDPRDT